MHILCKFDKGCKKRSTCTFAHSNASDNSGSTSKGESGTKGKWKGKGKGKGSSSGGKDTSGRVAKQPRASDLPRGVCSSYWESGECSFGASCPYDHSKLRNAPPSNSSISTRTVLHVESSKFSNLNSDWVLGELPISLREGNFKQLLSKLTKDDSSFDLREQLIFVNGFLASSQIGDGYTMEDAQHVFGQLSNPGGPALGKLRDILSIENVTTTQSSLFQRLLIPVFIYFSSEVTRNPPSTKQVNAVYTVLDQNAEHWIPTAIESIRKMMARKSAISGSSSLGFVCSSFLQVFVPIILVLTRYLSKISNAILETPEILQLILELKTSFTTFKKDLLSSQPQFSDAFTKEPLEDRRFILAGVSSLFDKVEEIVSRSQGRTFTLPQDDVIASGSTEANFGARRRFEIFSQPPGLLRAAGPRHDNDFISIADIVSLPSQAELLSEESNFVPGQFPGAPHHLEENSMEKLLDIQYRLLREDSISPLCYSIKSLVLEPRNARSKLASILANGGGRYRATGNEGVDLQLYHEPSFRSIGFPPKPKDQTHSTNEDLSIEFSVRVPPRFTASAERSSHLSQGAVVGLVLFEKEEPSVFLGVVSSKGPTLSPLNDGPRRLTVRVSFFDSEVYLRAIENLAAGKRRVTSTALFFEVWKFRLVTLEPFLTALQKVEPTSIPFSHHLVGGNQPRIPPLFARVPGFTYDLSSLLRINSPLAQLRLDAQDENSIEGAKSALQIHSTMDNSQATALVDSLCSDMALVSGPPGTGKSYLGTQMVQALIKNSIKPILIITTTNHALDSFLESILDAGITEKIIRCGSQSQSARIQPYSLYEATAKGSGAAKKDLWLLFTEKEELQDKLENIAAVASSIVGTASRWSNFDAYCLKSSPRLHRSITNAPAALLQLYKEEVDGGWKVTSSKKAKPLPSPTFAPAVWWITSADMQIYTRYNALMLNSFSSDRSIGELERSSDAWSFSTIERMRILDHWRSGIINHEVPKLQNLRKRLMEVKEELAGLQSKNKLAALTSNIDIIACTTNGAANILSLLSAARPKVLLVEEACEVLEAHLLAVMVPSIESCIQIGDPLQLRPSINTYHLSIDSPQGQLHRADESMFERLTKAGCPMSILHTQRRMRPEVSSLIRNYLYPSLEDHQSVLNYPSVRGMRNDVFFISHSHSEDHIGDQSSKTNRTEALLLVDVVAHLLRNGYKDVAVITAYAGQLLILRDLLQRSTFCIEVDVNELDKETLANLEALQEGNENIAPAVSVTPSFQKKTGKDMVRLSSVDAFQGLEAQIILLSLVRNVSSSVDEEGSVVFDPAARASIGFLKSPNRINVAISRAKQGMYIFGNAELLSSKAPMWNSVISQLESRNAVGPVAPFCCPTHPEINFEEAVVAKPGGISLVSPEGGCLADCLVKLPTCSHLCMRRCHPLDRTHATNTCVELVESITLDCGHVVPSAPCYLVTSKNIRCQVIISSSLECGHSVSHQCSVSIGSLICRAPCSILLDCKHPCRNLCGTEHSICQVPTTVTLACGHSLVVPCFSAMKQEEIACQVIVSSALVTCGHENDHRCSVAASLITCKKSCGGDTNCSHSICKALCSECRKGTVVSNSHEHLPHRCEKDLVCGHRCSGTCGDAHNCVCSEKCARSCAHGSCRHQCSTACPGCLSECTWRCPHAAGKCELSCSMPCTRLPCDEACTKVLSCGCVCTSICGEDCSKQVCKLHAPVDRLEDVVDLLMLTTLEEVELNSKDLSGRLMTLSCGHSFTVETLDHIFEMKKFYSNSSDGSWNGVSNADSASKIPTCPSCRTPISLSFSFRYSRPLKAAQLLVQEKYMISQSSTLLNTIQEELNSIPSLVLGFDTLEGPSCDIVAASQFIERSLNKSNNKWIIPAAIYADLTKFGISGSIAVTWKGMQPLFKSHTRLAQLASKRSPATIAYESSFTTLYNKELNRLSSSVVEVGRLKESDRMMLEKSAQNYAESSIGSLPPRADTTISIQAIFLSLRIRARLVEEAQQILSSLPTSKETIQAARILENKAALHRFIGFVVDSSLKDVFLLIEVATQSKSSKKVLQGQLEKARLQFQRLELDVKARIAEFGRKSPFNSEYLCQIVNEKEQEIIVEELEKNISFFRNSAGGNVTTMKSNDAFISTEIEPSRLLLEKDFEGLIKLIKAEPFYQAVTKEERAAIALAIRTGAQPGLYQSNATWYTCLNGHHFAVGDCGALNQSAVCPECGVPIGGQNSHHSEIRDGQRVDREFGMH